MEKAWLTAMAAVLGVGEACPRHETPAAVREVAPLASAEPSASATVEAIAPLASASAAPSATASAKAATTSLTEQQQLLAALSGSATDAGLGDLLRASPGHESCGAVVRSVCGISDPRMHTQQTRAPVAQVNVSVTNGTGNDDHVVAATRPRFRACASQGLAQDPDMSGKLVLLVRISPNGDVAAVNIMNNAGIGASTAACMRSVITRASFTAGLARTLTVSIMQTKQ